MDVRCLPAPGAPSEARRIAERVAGIALEAGGVSVEDYLDKLAAQGGVIEERIVGHDLRSPSVQIQVTPAGEVELLSTHDQILGGPRRQSYLGCRFPADAAYAPAISALGRKIGRRLAEIGVIRRFAIDFVVARSDDGGWRPYAIEINLRKGGTTHPYETLAHLTGGAYQAAGGTFTTPSGQRKHYVATDHLEAPELRTLGRSGVLELAARRDLRFNRLRRTGVVFHMLSSLDELGRTGFTAIENSPEAAEELYRRVTVTLLEAADAAATRATRTRSAALRRPIEVAPVA
ncbi:MAG: peptide ligase PGM1-related protein [Solirubrobacteraceae bacterium]